MLVLSFNKAVGKAIRELRDSQFYSITQMSQLLGISKTEYISMESGAPVENAVILKICTIFQIRVSQFFFLVEAEYSAMTDFNWLDQEPIAA